MTLTRFGIICELITSDLPEYIMIRFINKIVEYLNYLLLNYNRETYYVIALKEEVMHNTDTQHSRSLSSHENTSIMHNLHQNCVSFSKYPNISWEIYLSGYQYKY